MTTQIQDKIGELTSKKVAIISTDKEWVVELKESFPNYMYIEGKDSPYLNTLTELEADAIVVKRPAAQNNDFLEIISRLENILQYKSQAAINNSKKLLFIEEHNSGFESIIDTLFVRLIHNDN